MHESTFFFYDLETSGFDPRSHRIMQFAGQRTTMELEPIGEPVNLTVKLTNEVLPSPDAIIITGITPQQTVREGITEAELMRQLTETVFTPGTIATGFNSVRFDDVFIRYLHYRNFYDPYEWAYAEDRSRWDFLDVVRMARALRPEGFTWPVDEEGKAVNKLALLSAANGLEHTKAHDALSDVVALIGVAKHLRLHQPRFFEYLLKMRSKHEVNKLVDLGSPEPFIYTSGRYPKTHNHTTIAYPIAKGKNNSVIVYDLRQNPALYANMSLEELAAIRFPTVQMRNEPSFKPFPAKELVPGNCPAVAPLAALNYPGSETGIGLKRATAQQHLASLHEGDLIEKLRQIMEPRTDFAPQTDADAQLYDGFINGTDKIECSKVRSANPSALASLTPRFNDKRLPELFMRYKARNFPDTLTDVERSAWETYRTNRLQNDWPTFAEAMQRAAIEKPEAASVLEDLKLWAQNLAPEA